MDLRQLHYFVTIAETGSFSRAAKALYMTQPPLSSAIAQLESELGARLFERSSRGVRLTLVGEEMLLRADHVLAQTREMRRQATVLSQGYNGTLAAGSTPMLSDAFMPPILRQICGTDRIDVTLHEGTPDGIIRKVMDGDVDVGLIGTMASSTSLDALYHGRVRVEQIGTTVLDVALPVGAISPARPVSLHELRDQEFAVPVRAAHDHMRARLLHAFQGAGLEPPRLREVSSLRAALPLVSAGVVCAVLPRSFRLGFHPSAAELHPLVDGPEPLTISVVSLADSDRRASQIARFTLAARTALEAVSDDADEAPPG